MKAQHAGPRKRKDTLRLRLWDTFWLWRGGDTIRAALGICFGHGEPRGGGPAGYEPCQDCGGAPADLHGECQPGLTIRPFDGELTAERLERIKHGLREALREEAAGPRRPLVIPYEPDPIGRRARREAAPDEPPTEFLAAPVAEPGISYEELAAAKAALREALREPVRALAATITVEPTLPPLPSYTPNWEPRGCPDVPPALPWTPPAADGLREWVDAVDAGPARSGLGSWVDQVLAAPLPPGLGHLRPMWADSGWGE